MVEVATESNGGVMQGMNASPGKYHGWPPDAKTMKERDSPTEPTEGCSPALNLDNSPVKPF